MIRKNIIWLYSLFVSLLFVVGCQKDNGDYLMTGTVSFDKVTLCDDTSDKDVNTKGVSPIFAVQIVDIDGKVCYATSDVSSIAGQKINLQIGEYTVKAWTDNASAAAFDTKVYYGETKITVSNGVDTPVNVECKLDNVLVDIKYTQNIKDNFTSYKIVVANSVGELTFEQEDARVGYFSYENKISYTIFLTDALGDNYTYKGVVDGLNVRDYLHFNIDVKPRTDKDDLLFDLIINTSVNEVVTTITTSLTPNDVSKPTITLRDKDITLPFVVGQGVGADMFFDITATGGVKRLFVNFLSGAPASFPKMVEVLGSDASMLKTLGISTNITSGALSGVLTMTEFTRMLTAGSDGMNSVVLSLGIYDDAYNLTTQKVTINVVQAYLFTADPITNTHIDWSTGRGITEVAFGGSWVMNDTPEGLTFKYRRVGETSWNIVDEQLVVIDEPNKTYTTTVKLNLATQYEMQAVSLSDAGKVLSFTTVRPSEPTNMDFEDWWLDGKTWFPYAQNGTKDWDSGNGGLTSSLVGKSPNTIPEYTKVHSGTTAVKSTSVEAPVVGFAAGNLFTGYFKFSIAGASNPLSMVHFGRPYAARPTQMRGYYIYNPVTINTGKEHDGEMDQCNIYISLEKWGDGVTERPANRVVIGVGDFRTSASNDSYKEFVADVKYSSNEMPDHVVIVATSSIYGDQFIGGKGSTLYVDNIELFY